MAIANGLPTYTPPQFLQKFEHDLNFLPTYLAQSNDFILVENMPSEQFLERISSILPDKPYFFTSLEQLNSFNSAIEFNGLEPWGWSPAEHRKLQCYKKYCVLEFTERPNTNWVSEHKDLYSRSTALQVLNYVLECNEAINWLIPNDKIPVVCKSVEEVEAYFTKWGKIVVKSPWSSSGRGLIVLNNNDFHHTYKQWINGILGKQLYVMVEPLFNKLADLSFHFEIKANEWTNFLGQASFSTTDGGQYIGNNIQSLPLDLNTEERQFCETNLIELPRILEQALKASAIFKNYTGVLGVDVLLIKENGRLNVHPCLEINLRNNMGTLALAIRDRLHAEAQGMWQIKYFDKGCEMLAFDKAMAEQHPLELVAGKLFKGYLPLTEPGETKKFLAYLIAE